LIRENIRASFKFKPAVVDLERTGCGDASACLSLLRIPLTHGRLSHSRNQEPCRTSDRENGPTACVFLMCVLG
jgi:hypothetical protein